MTIRSSFLSAFLPLLLLASACAPGTPPGPGAPGPDHGDAHDHGDEDHGERAVTLDPGTAARAGVEVAVAGPGAIAIRRELPGEVRPNGDRLAHVAPRVGGIAREVHASLGDRVEAGQLLAVLESRELAEARAAWLAARARVELARKTFAREDRLRARGVTAEQDWLDARTALAEAEIELRAARQGLLALGVPATELTRLPSLPEANLATLRLVSPLPGEVIDRHVTVGEAVAALVPVFTVADLSTVWIDLSVYPRDLAHVVPGAPVELTGPGGRPRATGRIAFVSPLLGEETRTALARVILPNPGGEWRPGTFVTGRVTVEDAEVPVRVPLAALVHPEEGETALFVAEDGNRFVLREVTLGRRDARWAEVTAGIAPGERYVARGGFALFAELGKDAFGDGHGH